MLDIQKLIGAPKIVVTETTSQTSIFEVKNLPRWFGHTLWNALRRIILWYNIGWAITGLKIKGVQHEYHVIDGVKESVIDMMLQFKKLRFLVDEKGDSVQWISQKFSKAGVYTSADLKLPADISILDTNTYLFEITDPSVEVVFDIRVERWYGYYSIDFLRNRDQKDDSTSDVATLLLDNDFGVVDYVKYDVQEVIEDFSGTTKDTLIVELKSRYESMSPKQIIMFAWEVLASYAKLFIFDTAYIDRSVLVEYAELQIESDKLPEETNIKTMPIDALPLSERTRNALIKNDILYVEDLEKKKKWELLLMKWVWRKAIDEINSSLATINKTLIA
jgi:DNA-directed RNA polymerase subunit alpha